MKYRGFLVFVAGVLVLAAAGMAWLWPESTGGSTGEIVPAQPADTQVAAAREAEEAAADARREAISAAYGELAVARQALQRKLGDLKALTWGREWPAAKARSAGDAMMSAQYLLKNPPQLGAFPDVDGVRAEHARVNAALARLQEVEAELGAPAEPP